MCFCALLVRGTTEGFDGLLFKTSSASQGVDDLTDVYASSATKGFAECVTHTTGQPAHVVEEKVQGGVKRIIT